MNDNENENGKQPQTGEPAADQEPETAEAPDSPWTGDVPIDGTPGSDDPVAMLVEENANMKDKLLRTLADMENLRQRTAREIREARAYAISNFARDMLNAGDNMRRALEAVSEEARANAGPNLTALLEGVELTEREMHKAMEKHGVRKIEPLDERFDPHFHQAMFEVENPDVANGTVIQVMQAGYVIGDRVLRPSLVGVAKGGPKTAKPEPADESIAEETKAEEAAETPKGDDPVDDSQPAGAKDTTTKEEGPVGSRIDKSA